MSIGPTTTMTGYITAILATMTAHAWPSTIRQIGFRQPLLDEDEPTATILTPALYLNLTERRSAATEARAVIGPGRVARRCWLELHCLLSTATPNAPLELLEFSESAMALVDHREHPTRRETGQRWGLGGAVDRAEEIADLDAPYTAAWPGLAARVLTWEQVVYLPDL